jgi:PAS domain S-box-containing protein
MTLDSLFSRSIEHAVTGVVIADCALPDMPLIYINPAFCAMTGYSHEESIGRNCRFLQGSEHEQSELIKLRQAIKNGEYCKVVLKNYTKSGNPFWNELSISPVFDDQNKLTHFIGFQNDITQKVESDQQLIKAKELAEESTRLKTDFLNIISHELRTPLTVMLGNLPLLTDKDDLPPAEEIEEIAKDIEESGEHLLSLINELLDLSRIEQGKLKLIPEPLNIVDCINESIYSVKSLADTKGLEIIKNCIDFDIIGDRQRVKQILINLIGNAIKYTSQGNITISTSIGKNSGIIEIKDTGRGISKEFLPYIFDSFRQEDSSATRPNRGSGLGLSITKKLVEMHSGSIKVNSEVGQGSTFFISFPLI